MTQNTPQPHWFTALLAGWAALFVVHGLGRFAFTPMIPLMREQTGMSIETAGSLASINLLAYLLGSLTTFWKHQPQQRRLGLILGLTVNAISTLLLAVSDHLWWWYMLRFVNGFSNGLVFVYAPLLVMESLSQHQRMSWAGVSFTGVGFSIILSSLIIVASKHWQWDTLWWLFGGMALPLAAWSARQLSRIEPAIHYGDNGSDTEHKGFVWLGASYTCAGFGYIISMTFLPTIASQIPTLSSFAQMSWLFVGLAVTPSPLIWNWLGQRFGDLSLLRINFFIQATGAALPAILPNWWGIVIGGALMGGSFIGAVQLTLRFTRHHWPHNAGRRIGLLVTVYSVAQMLAPIIASTIYTKYSNFGPSLYLAAGALLLGGILTLPLTQRNGEATKTLSSNT